MVDFHFCPSMAHLFTILPLIGSRSLMLTKVTFVAPIPLVSCNIKSKSNIAPAGLDYLNPGSIGLPSKWQIEYNHPQFIPIPCTDEMFHKSILTWWCRASRSCNSRSRSTGSWRPAISMFMLFWLLLLFWMFTLLLLLLLSLLLLLLLLSLLLMLFAALTTELITDTAKARYPIEDICPDGRQALMERFWEETNSFRHCLCFKQDPLIFCQ